MTLVEAVSTSPPSAGHSTGNLPPVSPGSGSEKGAVIALEKYTLKTSREVDEEPYHLGTALA